MPFRLIQPGNIVAPPVAASSSPTRTRSDIIVVRSRTRATPPVSRPGDLPEAVQPPPDAPKRSHHVVDRTGPNWDENGDYLVGKRRPPVETRWRKGQSGNPRGPKPRKTPDPQAAFEQQILGEFTARVNGQDVTLNMGTFALQLLKTSAAKGTVKAQQVLLELFTTALRKSITNDPSPELEAWEQEVLDDFMEQMDLPAKPVVRQIQRPLDHKDIES